MSYVRSSPWTDAANAGEGIGNAIAKVLFQLPLMKQQMARDVSDDQFRRQQAEQGRNLQEREFQFHVGQADKQDKYRADATKATLEYRTSVLKQKQQDAALRDMILRSSMPHTEQQPVPDEQWHPPMAANATQPTEVAGTPISPVMAAMGHLPQALARQPAQPRQINTHPGDVIAQMINGVMTGTFTNKEPHASQMVPHMDPEFKTAMAQAAKDNPGASADVLYQSATNYLAAIQRLKAGGQTNFAPQQPLGGVTPSGIKYQVTP